MLEAIIAVSTAITALVGLGIKLWIDAKRKQSERRAAALNELSIKIQAATSDEERQKYVEELYRLRGK